ncbi:MAG: alpha/beta fold hydrolase [Actinomycetales bacterium]
MTFVTPPLVLLHGMRVSATMWDPLAADLRSHACRVHTPDLPGHGTARDRPFTVDAAVDDCASLLQSLDGRAVLIGHSLGGFIALATAARHPDLVSGVISIGASTQPAGVGLAAYRLYGRFLTTHPELATRLTDASARRFLPDEEATAWGRGGYTHEIASDVVAQVATLDPLGDLARYRGPVWLLNGGNDQFRLGERRFLQAGDHVRLTVWPGANHLSVIADTTRLSTFILDACARVSQDG